MNRNLVKIGTFLILVSVAIVYVYIISVDNDPHQIVIIYPDDGETKMRPKEAGGIVIPNSDSVIYENLKSQKSSRKIDLLPEPEQALNIISKKDIDSDLDDPVDKILHNLIPEEKRQTLHTERSDINYQDNDTSNLIDSSTDLNDIQKNTDLHSSSVNKSLNVVKVTSRANIVEQMKLSTKNYSSNYKVQLASVKSEAEGIIEGARIKQKYQKILGKSDISLKKVQNDKGQFFYLVLAGSYSSLSQAKTICRKLSSRQQQCIVAK